MHVRMQWNNYKMDRQKDSHWKLFPSTVKFKRSPTFRAVILTAVLVGCPQSETEQVQFYSFSNH